MGNDMTTFTNIIDVSVKERTTSPIIIEEKNGFHLSHIPKGSGRVTTIDSKDPGPRGLYKYPRFRVELEFIVHQNPQMQNLSLLGMN